MPWYLYYRRTTSTEMRSFNRMLEGNLPEIGFEIARVRIKVSLSMPCHGHADAQSPFCLSEENTYDERFAVGDAPILPLPSSAALNDRFVRSFCFATYLFLLSMFHACNLVALFQLPFPPSPFLLG